MMRHLRYCIPLFLFVGIVSFLQAQPADPLFRILPPSQTGVDFVNRIVDNMYFNVINYVNAYNGNGVAAGDVNNDGLPDLFFLSTQVGTRLYLNRGNFRFEDVTRKAGLYDSAVIERGVQMIDINADGRLDLFVCRHYQSNQLFVNNGDGTFTDRAKEYGINYGGFSTQSAFLDYDLDGDLDMYLLLAGGPQVQNFARNGVQDRFFRNNGNGTFTDITSKAGLSDAAYGLNVNAGDVNNDGYPDIYVTNDFEQKDLLYINNRNGTFTNAQRTALGHTSNTSMGSDLGDFNNDGLLDIYTTDMMPDTRLRENTLAMSVSVLSYVFDSSQVNRNCLQLNRGDGYFSEIGQIAGVFATDWSWAALFADLDNDGWQDIYVANGIRRDMTDKDFAFRVDVVQSALDMTRALPEHRLKHYAYRNNRDLTFEDMSRKWGLADSSHANSAVYSDLDRDGDLDLVVANIDSTPFIYQNLAREQGRGNYLQIKLNGTKQNRLGYGTRVELKVGGASQMQQMQTSHGYLGSTEPILHFGLGTATVVDSLRVIWPGGAMQTLTAVPVNQVLTLDQKGAKGKWKAAAPVPPVFTPVESKQSVTYRHLENGFDDLRAQRLLPQRLSEQGPGIAVGDVNGDGLEDVFIGGALSRGGGQIYVQNSKGGFIATSDSLVFRLDSNCEDTGTLLFDADGDGDRDLYVVSGGFEYDEGSAEYQDRLYINDGKGNFSKSNGRLPAETTSGSCVVAADYDRDGDLDLFVGGRVVPWKYPLPARSFILRNDGGKFSDATAEIAPELVKPGLVTSALWTDYDSDGWCDLMVTGHWMTPRFFHNDGGKRFAENRSTGLENSVGWWNSLASGDFDNDGDIDYLAGNLGTNWRFAQPKELPMVIYAADFDDNGSLDLVQSRRENGIEYPVKERMQIAAQMPVLNQKFTTWDAFGRAPLNQVIAQARLDTAMKLVGNQFSTSYIENLGGGKFRLSALPLLAQISPTYGMTAEDFNGDGNLDILMVGNLFDGPEPDVIRYDAGCGLLLQGDGAGGFTPLPAAQCGVMATGDTRGLALLRHGKGNTLQAMVVNNGHSLQTFEKNFDKSGGKLWTLDDRDRATHALVTMKNGRTRKYEFYAGSGYLTQSSPTLVITPLMKSMTLYSGGSVVREIMF